MKRGVLFSTVCFGLAVTSWKASAALITYDLLYSGVDNSATAKGMISFDKNILSAAPTASIGQPPPPPPPPGLAPPPGAIPTPPPASLQPSLPNIPPPPQPPITPPPGIIPAPFPVFGGLGNVPAVALGIQDFSITISGASAGNGTFGLSYVDNWVWQVGPDLDLEKELVAQDDFYDFNWCALFYFDCTAPAPGGVGRLQISANAEAGEVLKLVSMTPRVAVPEPASIMLASFGILGLMTAKRRGMKRLQSTEGKE